MKKITVFCLLLICALAIGIPIVNILKDYENKCNAWVEMVCGVVGGVFVFAFVASWGWQHYVKATQSYHKVFANYNYR